ncbi:alpha/beta hydrolase [Ruegeria lacuscaerulensis]|uniref:alpha/beta hydrolase n=1 Tax=Ruegeria lacuscaerulensis TaxID=55218 RepID=UPI00147A7BE5|nr:alpha/beta hydrolase [Ruegeria lacuscaerulensis]
MKPSDYPQQEPFTEIGARYHDHVMNLGSNVTGLDIRHGDNPYQSLLVCPADMPGAPVLCFIHGGGWTSGYKEWMVFMAPALNNRGITFVSLGYRLAPDHVFPVGLDDCADGVGWVYHNIAEHGGDPDRIFIGGHSAGGHYASLLTLQNDWKTTRGLPGNIVKGALPISGTFWFGEGSGLSIRPRFLGPEENGAEQAASPVRFVSGSDTPFLVAYGAMGFAHLKMQSERFADRLKEHGVTVETLELRGCDHLQASYAAGDEDGAWVNRASQFILNKTPE